MDRQRRFRAVCLQYALAFCGMVALSGCAAKYAQVPPRLALQPYGRVAVITFSENNGNRELSALATQRFAEALLRSQTGFEVLELQPTDSALTDLASRNVAAVFLGELKVSGIQPRGRLTAPASLNLNASVSAELSVRLLSIKTGGTVWRSSSAASSTVGRLATSGRLPSVSMRNPDEAYGEVVNDLVSGVTRDLRPTWVRQ
jgi:hypothetical protein